MTNPNNTTKVGARALAVARITVDLVADAGDWTALGNAEKVVQRAADAVAAWPGLIDGALEVSIALSSDSQVAVLNGQFRGKAKPTNVLSFPPGKGAPPDFLGDIVLAVETIGREANEQGTPFADHVQHLVVHGLLHLIGYDHDAASDAERMEALEVALLATLGIANPYTGDLVAMTKES